MKIDPKSRPVQITVALMIVLPTVYLGLGYVIASQAIAAKPGCYVWEDNHPDSWTSFDDWESFGTGEVAEVRVPIRQNFDSSPYHMDSYENASFPPRGDHQSITLRGWYVEVDPEAPVVILTHGMPSNGNCKPEMLLMQAFLAEGGINSLSFSLRNYGYSDQVSDYIAVGQVEYVDILGAYDWLIDSKGYQAGEVGLVGISLGGTAAFAFEDEPGIAAMWLDSAVLDFPLVVRNELGRMGFPAFLGGAAITVGGWMAGADLDGRNPIHAADAAGDRPVFLTHGLEDTRVSVEHAERFEERMIQNGGNVETWYVEDSAHVDAMWSDSEEYENRLTSFFHDAFGMNGS